MDVEGAAIASQTGPSDSADPTSDSLRTPRSAYWMTWMVPGIAVAAVVVGFIVGEWHVAAFRSFLGKVGDYLPLLGYAAILGVLVVGTIARRVYGKSLSVAS